MPRQPRPPIQRGWCPYSMAARQYLGISEDILLGAIKRHELPAWEKPITRGRKPGAKKEHHSYFVKLTDVDDYIRTHWPEAFPPNPMHDPSSSPS